MSSDGVEFRLLLLDRFLNSSRSLKWILCFWVLISADWVRFEKRKHRKVGLNPVHAFLAFSSLSDTMIGLRFREPTESRMQWRS